MTAVLAASGQPTVQALLGLVTLALIAGCGLEETDAPLPPPGPSVQMRIVEYGLTVQEPVPAGRVVVRVHNAGEQLHQLSVVKLPNTSPPIDELLESDTDEHEAPEILARIHDIPPGGTGMAAVEFTRQERYAVVDPSETPDGEMQARRGVAAEFRAGKSSGTNGATLDPSIHATPMRAQVTKGSHWVRRSDGTPSRTPAWIKRVGGATTSRQQHPRRPRVPLARRSVEKPPPRRCDRECRRLRLWHSRRRG